MRDAQKASSSPHRSDTKEKNTDNHKGCLCSFWSKCGGIRRGEDILLLRLTSKLVDLCKGYANSFRAAHECRSHRPHRPKKEKENHKGSLFLLVEVWRYSLCEDILLLRLTSKLVDLRKEYANSFLLRKNVVLIIHTGKKTKENHKGSLFFFGRSVEIRTPGLQYPKLARYQLRYTSKY